MKEKRNLNEINELIIKNYQEMVEILKELNANKEKYILVLERQLSIADNFINKHINE